MSEIADNKNGNYILRVQGLIGPYPDSSSTILPFLFLYCAICLRCVPIMLFLSFFLLICNWFFFFLSPFSYSKYARPHADTKLHTGQVKFTCMNQTLQVTFHKAYSSCETQPQFKLFKALLLF